jgi:NAD(P)H-dependent FMN reductase
MTASQLQVAVIVGSVRTGRVAPTVAGWLMTHLDRHDELSTDTIDPPHPHPVAIR